LRRIPILRKSEIEVSRCCFERQKARYFCNWKRDQHKKYWSCFLTVTPGGKIVEFSYQSFNMAVFIL